MNLRKITLATFLISSTFCLNACSDGAAGLRTTLGLGKDTPDEFAVITRAPLEMPAQLTLPSPNPGAPRPQETPTVEKAQKTVFGQTKKAATSASSAESALLNNAGADTRDTDIRKTVNKETRNMEERNRTVVQKLLKVGEHAEKSSATVVDAEKELERIQNNAKDGKNITAGETPVIEQ
ncbi:MAG: DUF3035 domain-containing protein [Alphaproteobacteria bacterium]